MRILILSNLSWTSWDTKIQLLKDWYKDCVPLDITLKQVAFSNIPFPTNVQVDRDWMLHNVVSLATGYDVIYFQMDVFTWKGFPVQAEYVGKIGGIDVIEGGCAETGDYYFVGDGITQHYDGDLWFNLAIHELSHVLYARESKQDNTHKYWETRNREQTLVELKSMPTVAQALSPTYKYFLPGEIVGLQPSLVALLDQARGIAGVPFVITSGFRTPAQNALVGGVLDSQHLTGGATDIACNDQTRWTIAFAGYQAGFKRIEVCPNHIHFDIGQLPHYPQNWLGVSVND